MMMNNYLLTWRQISEMNSRFNLSPRDLGHVMTLSLCMLAHEEAAGRWGQAGIPGPGLYRGSWSL